MKLKKCKTCNRCKALILFFGKYHCELGFEVEQETPSPAGRCYKPLTFKGKRLCFSGINNPSAGVDK